GFEELRHGPNLTRDLVEDRLHLAAHKVEVARRLRPLEAEHADLERLDEPIGAIERRDPSEKLGNDLLGDVELTNANARGQDFDRGDGGGTLRRKNFNRFRNGHEDVPPR